MRNQYHLDAFGEDQYIDLLLFNRELNCLVAVELKTGKFKTSYLGQLQGYLSVLDGFERKPHENPSIGLILCKDMNRSFVDYVIQDYARPMGVATYKTSKAMSDELRKALPDVEALKKLLDDQEELHEICWTERGDNMASSKGYLDFILEQLSELECVSYRAMMGEYILYYRGKVIGGIYDDRFLVKPTKTALAMMPNAAMELPYEGGKEMLLVDDVENRDFLCKLLDAMTEELPAPKEKKRKTQAL